MPVIASVADLAGIQMSQAFGRRKREIIPSINRPSAQVFPSVARPMLLAQASEPNPAAAEVQHRKMTSPRSCRARWVSPPLRLSARRSRML